MSADTWRNPAQEWPPGDMSASIGFSSRRQRGDMKFSGTIPRDLSAWNACANVQKIAEQPTPGDGCAGGFAQPGEGSMNHKTFVLGTVMALAAVFSCQVVATPKDQLAQCLVTHTSEADRAMFAKWLFAQMALSPDVAPMANISSSLRDKLNRQAGDLFSRLLADDCPRQTTLAYEVEGSAAIGYGFQMLGQVAGRNLMQNPQVKAGLSGFTKYLDKAKLTSILGSAAKSVTGGGDADH